MKKTIPILLILTLILFIVPVSANPMNLAKKFIDMGNHWAEVTVNKLIELGVIKGYEDNTFRPDNTITRAEFSTVIRKAFQLDFIDGNSFTDTNHHWAGKEIHTLVAKGIIDKSEYGTKYSPDEKITRIEMAKMIVRAMGLDAEAKEKANQTTTFADDKNIKAKDKGYIIIASENKIINGYPDNTFKPNGKATRAEASTMVIKALDVLKEQQAKKEQIDKLRDADGIIDTAKLEKNTIQELGYDKPVRNGDLDPKIYKDRSIQERMTAIDQISKKIMYQPEIVKQADMSMLPIKFNKIVITDIHKVPYEEAPYKGDTQTLWSLSKDSDCIVIEGYPVEIGDKYTKLYHTSSIGLGILNKKGEFAYVNSACSFDEWNAQRPTEKKIKEMFPYIKFSISPAYAIHEKFHAFYVLPKDFELENIEKIFIATSFDDHNEVLEMEFSN
ncbi:S-layer homology domain-containing protein [Thermotalea metallivorans]|uniref:S-layer protein sap n=1 Tax=Thermotalea metallivorans TaxID=520762 RepID=A0A140L404_9FIRM|nr:S-layer homology domain-containing protein [Thermotalea metallivorans]KXG75279.1 S-layer protein sap [Thermotalea metallivorans]